MADPCTPAPVPHASASPSQPPLEPSELRILILAARDGHEALDSSARQRPHIVLLDLLMPRLDGFAVLEELRQKPAYQQLPGSVLTAKTLTEVERALLGQRACAMIQKQGWDRDTLMQELRGLLHASRDPLAGG